jgi:hypothetical protein
MPGTVFTILPNIILQAFFWDLGLNEKLYRITPQG